MTTKKRFGLFFIGIVAMFFMCISVATAQNKVVVIPLIETVETSLEPFAPLAAASPQNSAYAIGTYAVHDNITGLYWQIENDNTQRSWDDAWDYCQSRTIGIGGGPYYFSTTDWRLPSVAELISIVDYGINYPAIDLIAFPGTNSSSYWAATISAEESVNARYVSFINGYSERVPKSNTFYVRCVRGLPARDSVFKNNGNDTMTDLATGLTWQRQDDNNEREWAAAHSYCQALSLGGKTNWRVPNIKELQSIVDNRITDPAIDPNAFPGTNSSSYWSATTYSLNSGSAWFVAFRTGAVSSSSKSVSNYVRCVR